MDAGVTVQGDTSKMTDPTTKALLADGVTVHVEGASQSDPTVADMTHRPRTSPGRRSSSA